jgi:hypothetical protein
VSAFALLLRAIRTDWRRYRNRKARERHWVRGAITPDYRDWSGAFMQDLKTWRAR